GIGKHPDASEPLTSKFDSASGILGAGHPLLDYLFVDCTKKLTMTTISIEQAGKFDGQEVTLKGWLYNLRESGKLLFPIFRDGTGIIQGVCALKENPEAFESLKGLTQESSVIVTGKIRAEKRAPGGYEIGVTKIQIVQRVPESTPFPIQLKEHGVDFLLDQRHLWIRT